MHDWSNLQSFRERLDQLDGEIMALFGKRYAIRREVLAAKKEYGLPVQDPARVNEVINRAVQNAEKHNVPADFAKALYELVIDYSHKFEEQCNL